MRKHLFIFLIVMVFTFVLANPYAESQEPPKPPIVIAVDGLALREVGPMGVEPYKLTDKNKVIETPSGIGMSTAMSTPAIVETIPNKEPDGYLAGALKASNSFKNAEIKPYIWSRDPADTNKVVPDLKKNIEQAYEVAKNDKRSLIIVGHSWGSVLAHEALSELSKEGKEVKVERFITMGSPLETGAGAAALLKAIETVKEGLQFSVKKPDNVKEWDNYWAAGDRFSSYIKAADKNIKIDKGQEPSPLHPIQNTGEWHKAEKYISQIDITLPASITGGTEKTSIASQKPLTQPTSLSEKSDKQKAEEPKPAVAKKGETTKKDTLVIKKGEETPTIVTLETKKETTLSASSSEEPKQAAVMPKPASPATDSSTAKKEVPAPSAPSMTSPKTTAKPASPRQETLDALQQKLAQLKETLTQLQQIIKTNAVNQAVSNIIPIATGDAIKIINLPQTLPTNLPKGNVADVSKLRESTANELVVPVDVRFTQTFDGLFTQSADYVGSLNGSHSGSLTDGTRVNVKGDSVAGDFTGSFNGKTVAEPGYTPATHNNSAFSGSSVGNASAKGLKGGNLYGTMTVTVPAGTQTATVTGKITIKTDGSLTMPSYSGPVTVNATGVKVGTMSGSWSQSKTR